MDYDRPRSPQVAPPSQDQERAPGLQAQDTWGNQDLQQLDRQEGSSSTTPTCPPPAGTIDDRARAVLAANREAEAELAPEERTAVRGVNRVRYLVGLPLLELDARLTRACLNHARDMLEHGFHDHVSPVKGRETFMMRAEEEGTSARNENLNQGAPDGEAAVLSWWQSYGHRKALLGPYGAIGMTHRAPHWVSLFR